MLIGAISPVQTGVCLHRPNIIITINNTQAREFRLYKRPLDWSWGSLVSRYQIKPSPQRPVPVSDDKIQITLLILGRSALSNLWQWSDGWNQHKIHIFTPTLLPTKSTLEFDYMLNTEHVTCNCQCWDELRRHSDKSLLSLRWASADWGRCPRILFVCKSFISSSKGLASYCKAETTFTFHFSIFTL